MKIVLFLLTGFVLIGFFLGAVVWQQEKQMEGKIYPHVLINSMDFGRQNRADVERYFSQINKQFATLTITVMLQNSPVATFSGSALDIGFDGKGAVDRAFLIGRSKRFTSRTYQKIATIFGWQNFRIDSAIGFDETPLQDMLSHLKDQYDKPAKNALFQFERGKVVSFRQEEKGQEIADETFLKDFEHTVTGLVKHPENKTLVLTLRVIQPEITLAKANEFGIEELIATGKSDFSHSIPGRIHNVNLAASKFNGVLIPKNSVFSFNDTIGDISSLTGYQPAYIIKSGKTVLGDGGGVCQVSTTLFRAALNAGLPIVERAAHAYRVGYYENDSQPGFDATVFAPSPDLKIKNDTPASILIQTEIDADRNLLYFRFYGKKDGRKVEISPVRVYDVVPPLPEVRQDDPTLKKGVVKQVDFPAWGSKAIFTYKVTYPTSSISEKKFLSVYRPWQAVYLVGTAD